jgi:hypothetical protein
MILIEMESAARKLGLQINQEKTKYMTGRCIEEFWAQYMIKRRKIGGY